MNKYYNINNLFDEKGEPVKVSIKIKRKNNQIDYKTAYETTFECNKILSNNYNELDKRINKAIEYINNREEDNTTCSVCSVICSDLISILRGEIDNE